MDPPLTWQPRGKPSKNQVRNTATAESKTTAASTNERTRA